MSSHVHWWTLLSHTSNLIPLLMITALVSWPSAPLTNRLVLRALGQLEQELDIVSVLENKKKDGRLIQWSTYDDMDHELTNVRRNSVLASSYTFRKALIRKHYLSYSIHSYLTKYPASILGTACPQTFDIDVAFADELDEKWADELYELSDILDNNPERWWILKPGMADRGMGIRLFNTRESLEQIFEEFELSDDGENNDEEEPNSTAVVTSQLRHFVIQEYVMTPLLFDPHEIPLNSGSRQDADQLRGHKFHLRAYCVASGALQLYLYDRILALFCSVPYTNPGLGSQSEDESHPIDLAAHLTNTSLQTSRGEEGVRLFDELVGCHILNDGAKGKTFTRDDKVNILDQMKTVLAETFRAVVQMPIHFQPLENAFELYGIDFLVDYLPSEDSLFQVKILEVNSEPAIELTGPRLTWILEDLFGSIAKICVQPFVEGVGVEDLYGRWNTGETKEHLLKCLDEGVRRGTRD